MRRLMGLRRRMDDDAGTALTEFAIVAPLFIILIYWSQFFADLGILKLKAEEAARYATWEMTAHRATSAVSNEIQTRFVDLESPAARNGTKPAGALSWPAVTVARVNIQDRIEAKFSGRIEQPASDGSFLGDVIEAVSKFLNKAADWVIKQLEFDTRGMARSEVTFTAQNKLFPSGNVLGIFFDSGINPTISITARSPDLLWNTWKAWPGKAWGGSVETDVYDTYPRVNSRDSAPEKVVANQVAKMTWFGLGQKLTIVDDVLAFAKLPGIFGAETWREPRVGAGPISMLPGDVQTQSWQPGYQQPLQRIGNEWERSATTVKRPQDTVNPGVDRQRFTVPSRLRTVYWSGRGGESDANKPRMVQDNQNPYVQMYRCRSAYYMGATRPQLQHYNQSDWANRAHPGCR